MGVPSQKRSRLILFLVAALGGIALGGVAVAGDRQGVPRVMTLVANLAAPWGLVALLVGRVARSPREGAVAGGGALLIGMAAFYMFTPALYLHSARNLIWTAVALLVGPLMGVCGAISKRAEPPPRLASVIPAGIILGEGAWIAFERRVWRWNLSLEPHRWNDVVVLVALAIAALAIPVLLGPRSGLIRTYLLMLAVALAGAGAMAGLSALLISV